METFCKNTEVVRYNKHWNEKVSRALDAAVSVACQETSADIN